MKTILVATDGSQAAQNACLYGAGLAKAFNARLILFSAYQQVAIPVAETPIVIGAEEMKIRTQQQLEETADTITANYSIPVDTFNQEGAAANSILETAASINADIIITGMKKSGKGIRRLVGDTITALLQTTPIPLLVIPEEVSYTSISTIALASDSDVAPETDAHLLDSFREIAERFHSKLYLVRVTKNELEETYEILNRPTRLSKMIGTCNPQYECMGGKDVTLALNSFISGHQVNMLALLPHKHSLLHRWFIKSITRSMIFETDIPLLIVPDRHTQPSNN